MYYNMETIVKQTREVGTSAGVLLPRDWLNKKVAVTLFLPSIEDIIKDIMDILLKNNLNEEAKGIYLFGSYARGDYDSDSDIDVLVITQNISKLIKHNNYEIVLVSETSFSKNISNSLMYASMLKEIKIILNRNLIEKYLSKKIKLNTREIFAEIKRMIRINRETAEILKENNENIPDGIMYSLVLRLRELYMIKCLISNSKYDRRDFLEIVGEMAYSAYSRVKRDKRELENVSSDEAIKLLNLSEKWLKELKE